MMIAKIFSYYADAVKNGEITPFESAHDIRSFDREMSFIMNQTMEEWNNKYGKFTRNKAPPRQKSIFAEWENMPAPTSRTIIRRLNGF